MNATSRSESIDRVGTLTRDVFERDFLASERPVILTHGLSNWKALSEWSPEYFRSTLGAKRVQMISAETGSFSYETGTIVDPLEMDFGTAVDLICNPGRKLHYICQRPMHTEFPELADDFDTPDLIPEEVIALNMWFGSSGNVTPLHFDPMNNLFCQVYGRKKFSLFDPLQTEYLYPFPDSSPMPHVSLVNIEHPDPKRFPRFALARPIEVVIHPGEVLFLPAFWWHHVRSLETSISVNFWWLPRFKQLSNPNALRFAVTSYDVERFASLRGSLAASGFSNFVDFASFAVSTHNYELAVLSAGAEVEDHIRALCRTGGIVEKAGDDLVSLESLVSQLGVTEGDRARCLEWVALISRAKAAERNIIEAEVRRMIQEVQAFTARRI